MVNHPNRQQAVTMIAYYRGVPGDRTDLECRDIFLSHGGEEAVGSGANLETGWRDVEYKVPARSWQKCLDTLRNAGFKVRVIRTVVELYDESKPIEAAE